MTSRRSIIGFLSIGIASSVLAAPTEVPESDRNIRLPKNDSHYRQVSSYIEDTPDADYRHASPAAYEAFRDMKFGIRVHWGLYSIESLQHESWPFLEMSNARRQEYQALYKTWNPTGFDAAEWTDLFQQAGARFFTFTSKHHEGFSMFATRSRIHERVNWTAPGGPRLESCDLAYSIMETPFHRDVVKELTDAAHARGLKIDLYFSLPEWYDADFRPYNYDALQIPDAASWAPNEVGKIQAKLGKFQTPVMVPDPTLAETARMLSRVRDQLTELLTNYGRIDMIGLDQWLGPKVWPQLKATLKQLRRIQPDVMFRARGIGNYGDYFTPERFVPGDKQNTGMPWFVIYPLAGSFSYDPDPAHYKGARWIVRTLADTIAKGGNLEIGIGPDALGRFHPSAIAQMREAGAWIRANAEAVYGTRERPGASWKEGDNVRYTQSKDGRTVYAICLAWPGQDLVLHTVGLRPGSTVELLGDATALTWRTQRTDTVIELPARDPQPGALAYVFRLRTAGNLPWIK